MSKNAFASRQEDWLGGLREHVLQFLDSLKWGDLPGRFSLVDNPKEATAHSTLGFSCYGLKTLITLRAWDDLPEQIQNEWKEFIQSFQRTDFSIEGVRSQISRNAFCDPSVIEGVNRKMRIRERVWARLGMDSINSLEALIMAESKQAIATLAEVESESEIPYYPYPEKEDRFVRRVKALGWTRPWHAGGQAAIPCTLLQTDAPRLPGSEIWVSKHHGIMRQLYAELAQPDTGAYYPRGSNIPSHGEMINGAMKVLTGLAWLNEPIHFPEALIDSCLQELPSSDSCHLVDVVYVLHRCGDQSPHRHKEIVEYFGRLLNQIYTHYQEDGGFSYFSDGNQTHYYGAPIAEKRVRGDLHGTGLLTWAVAMILDSVDHPLKKQWAIMKP